MAIRSLRDLFIDELKDVADAERRLTKALPKMSKTAQSAALARAFDDHLEQTVEHLHRVEEILDSLDAGPGRKTCKAMVGLLAEGDELAHEKAPDSLKDIMLIAAAQKVEHYEMATYGCLRTWAELLGEQEASRLLQATLDEEGETDHRLTEIAQTLNMVAMNGEGRNIAGA